MIKNTLKYFLILVCLFLSSCDLSSPEQNFLDANIYADKKDYKKAIEELDKCLRKKKNYRRALFNRAVFKSEIKDYNGAYRDYKKILSTSKCTECLFQISVLLVEQKRYEKAIEILNLTLETDGVDKHNAIFKSNIDFSRDDPNSDYNVDEEIIYYERGLAYLKINQYKKAIIDFEKIIDYGYSVDEGHFYIGESYLGLKEYSKACENYEKSLEYGYLLANKKLDSLCRKK